MFVNDTSQIILLRRAQCKYGMQSVLTPATNRTDNPFIRYARILYRIAERVMDLRDPITNALIRLIDDPPFSAFGITDIFRAPG